jgi:hypothetical protein
MKLRSTLRAEGSAPISLFAFQDIIFAATGIFLFVSILMTLFGKIDLLASEALQETDELREELKLIAEGVTATERKIDVLKGDPFPDEPATALQSNRSKQDELEGNIWLYDIAELLQHNQNIRGEADSLYQELTTKIMEMNRRELRLDLLQSGGYEKLMDSDWAIIREGPAHDFREPIFLSLDSKGYTITYPGRAELDQNFETLEQLSATIRSGFQPDTQSFLIYIKPSGIPLFNQTKEVLQKLGYSIGYEPALEDFAF